VRAKARAYLLTPLAEQDLEDIWLYTCRSWSLEQADDYHASIVDAIEALASGRRQGRDASDIRDGYRKHAVGRHLIFYREREDALLVVRILHQSMDIAAHIGRSGA
jgi:toxin ParE1/3/4